MDYSPPGSSVHGIFQARLLEQIAIPFSLDLPYPASNLGLLHCRQIIYSLCLNVRYTMCWFTYNICCKMIIAMKVKVKLLSRLTLCNLWDCTCKAPPSMGFSRQDYWSGLPFPSPGDLPSPGIKPRSPALQPDSLLSEPQGILTNSFILSHDYHFSFVVRTCKIYSLSNFYVYNIVSLAIITIYLMRYLCFT